MIRNAPVPSVAPVRVKAVSVFRAVTFASSTTAPLASRTTPKTDAVVWPLAIQQRPDNSNAVTKRNKWRLFISNPFQLNRDTWHGETFDVIISKVVHFPNQNGCDEIYSILPGLSNSNIQLEHPAP